MQYIENRSLYERLGALARIATIMDVFVDRIMADPRLPGTRAMADASHPVSPAALKYLLTGMLCESTGGPPQHTELTISEAIRLLTATDREWQVFLADLQQTLDEFSVPAVEQEELKVLLGAIRADRGNAGGLSPDVPRFAQTIVSAVPSLIYVFDIERTKIVFVNRNIFADLGYEPELQAQEANFIRALMHPDDWPPFLEYLRRLGISHDERHAGFEYRLRHRSGAWRWFHSRDRVFGRNENGDIRETIGTASDVTERKDAEDRSRFIAELNQAMLPIADTEQIMSVVVRMVGEYLGVDRCGYAEVEADEDHFVVVCDYTRGSNSSIVGRYQMSEFDERERQVLRGNRPYVVNDIDAESPEGADLSLYRLGNIRALICVPLNKEGHFVARMAVHQSTPRRWAAGEIELLTKVANRCWESVERARALRRLKESDERYRAFIANSSEAVWRYELEQAISLALSEEEQIEMLFKFAYLAECNDAMARMYGYEQAEQILGARLADLLVRSDPQNIAFLHAFRQAGYRLADFETREVDRHGNTKFFLNNLTAIVSNGEIVHGWGTQRDITEQKRAAEALKASEERLRRISDVTQDALWEIDLKTNRLWWSEGAQPLFGRSSGELRTGLEDWYDAIHRDDVDRVKTQFEGFMRGDAGEWVDEYRFRRADGSYTYVFDHGRKFFDESGATVLIAGAMVDMTRWKLAEAALRESEERYRLLTELSPDGIVIASSNGTIQLANPSILRMLGLEQDQVIGRNLFDFLSPESLEHCVACMKTLMTDDKPATQVEAAFRNRDGRDFPVEVNAVRFDWKGQLFAQIVIHDMSSRKEAEAERRLLAREMEAERDRLRQILEQMPIGVAIAEAPSGRLHFHNLEAVNLLRDPLLPDREDLTPYGPEEYLATRSLHSGEVIKSEEMRYPRRDGTEAFLSLNSAPIYDAAGRMVLAVVTFIDITDRKRAEQELLKSEERFAKAFKASPDSLVISRLADGVVLEVNDSFLALSGYSRDEVVGKSTLLIGLYVDQADRARALSILKEKNRVQDHEFQMRRKSGEVRLMLFSAEPLELRGEQCWLTIARDITERKQAEEALRKSEEEARRQLAYVEAIYATAPVGLCFVDTDLRYRSINERLARLNGKSVEEHIGRSVLEVVPEIGTIVEPYYRQVIETGEPVLNVEVSADKQGISHHFVNSYYPIRDRERGLLGVNAVVVDITQRKVVEQEREGRLVQEKAAREEAESANRMKDEFLATISHELRTPLTSILGWARVLLDGSPSPAQAHHALGVIERSARSQTELINDLLDTSSIITGRLKLDAHVLDIAQVFQAAIDVIRPSAQAKRIELQVMIDGQGGQVFGDARRLQQVIWNLLSNAVKFTNAGGQIVARLTGAGGQVEISISDNGAGIESQFLPYVFDPFRQADSTSTRRYGGLGLGLAIVRHLVEMHGGGVSAFSQGKGKGATFKVTLPLASEIHPSPQAERSGSVESGAKHSAARPPNGSQKLHGVSILVVEDDPDTLEMLKFILVNSAASVTAAASASAALDALEHGQPDVIVSDVAMPGQDGYELIRKVRSREPERGGNIPAVALTAHTRDEDRARSLAEGFQKYVPKPVDPEELVAILAELIRPSKS